MKNTYIKKILSVLLILSLSVFIFGVTTAMADGEKASEPFLAYGIDVSSWQGKIDWSKVKNDGKTFAIVRAGTTKGKDTYFEENYKNAKSNEIQLGCYFYTYATTVEEAEKDAYLLLSWLEGKQFEYPVFYDMENEVQLASGMTTQLRTEMCLAFIRVLEENGWYAGTYANANWYNNYLNKEALGQAGELWLASWMNSGEPTRDYRGQYGLWQYTDKGKVSGISGNVDLDVSYIDYFSLMRTGGFNGYSASVEYVDEEWIITSDNGVNIRNGPGVVYKRTDYIPYGTRIHVTAKVSDSSYTWGRIEVNGNVCWCVLNYAVKTESSIIIKNEKLVADEHNRIIGLKNGEKITTEMFDVDGFANVEIVGTDNGYGTGTKVNLVLGNTVIDTYYVVIDGDINGDLYIDAYDLTYSTALTNFELTYDETSPEFMASDLNKDGVCDIFDCEILSTLMLCDDTNISQPEIKE